MTIGQTHEDLAVAPSAAGDLPGRDNDFSKIDAVLGRIPGAEIDEALGPMHDLSDLQMSLHCARDGEVRP